MDYERLANQHKDAVYRQMVRVCGNHDDAEDALVEALLSAYRSLDKLRDESLFRAWLAMIARRVCGRIKRRESLTPLIEFSEMELRGYSELPSDDIDPAELVARTDLKACVTEAIRALPEIYRDVYVMREIEGAPAEDVSKRLGLSIAALKSRLHRARAIVREHLDSNFCSALA